MTDILPMVKARPKPFHKRRVTVTLTGEEWTTLLARILHRELSLKGEQVYRKAADKLNKQLMKASK